MFHDQRSVAQKCSEKSPCVLLKVFQFCLLVIKPWNALSAEDTGTLYSATPNPPFIPPCLWIFFKKRLWNTGRSKISEGANFWRVIQSGGHLIAVATLWCLVHSRQIQIDVKEKKMYILQFALSLSVYTGLKANRKNSIKHFLSFAVLSKQFCCHLETWLVSFKACPLQCLFFISLVMALEETLPLKGASFTKRKEGSRRKNTSTIVVDRLSEVYRFLKNTWDQGRALCSTS